MLFMDSDASYLSIGPTWLYADIQCQRHKNNAENPKYDYPIMERQGKDKRFCQKANAGYTKSTKTE